MLPTRTLPPILTLFLATSAQALFAPARFWAPKATTPTPIPTAKPAPPVVVAPPVVAPKPTPKPPTAKPAPPVAVPPPVVAPTPTARQSVAPVPVSTPVVVDTAGGGVTYTGRLSYYGDGYKTLQNGNDPPPIGPENGGWYGACYNTFWEMAKPLVPRNFNLFAALNSAQFQSLTPRSACGVCAAITHPLLQTRVVVEIVDSCPGCPLHGLDISHQAFAQLLGGSSALSNSAAAAVGIIEAFVDPLHWEKTIAVGIVGNVQWEFTNCSGIVEDATFRVDGVPADWVIEGKVKRRDEDERRRGVVLSNAVTLVPLHAT